MSKRVAVIVRNTPFNSERNSEALRMTVGLTTGDHEITVLFLDDGVLSLRALDPALIGADDANKHLGACRMLGVRLVAEEEALRRLGVTPTKPVDIVARDEALRAIAEADVVVPLSIDDAAHHHARDDQLAPAIAHEPVPGDLLLQDGATSASIARRRVRHRARGLGAPIHSSTTRRWST
jgi:tRNA 2-thiouridine synthesizing protein C